MAVAVTGVAEDRITVRGTYFREPSTRVVQPIVQVTKDLPHGVDVGAHYLLDAITSASAAAGTTVDNILTEKRQEFGAVGGSTVGHTRLGAFYRHSGEPDYLSNTIGLSWLQGIWDNSGSVAVNAAYTWDTVDKTGRKKLKTTFSSVTWDQAITPTLVGGLSYGLAHLEGHLENVYLSVPNYGHEALPPVRWRHAFNARLARYFPGPAFGIQAYYRLYQDWDPGSNPNPWNMWAHTVEGRLYKQLGRDFEMRLSYRYHTQRGASFWCNTDPTRGGSTDCYGQGAQFHSADVKLGPLHTQFPEVKLLWDTRGFDQVPMLRWARGGTAEVSYGYFMQSTRYGNAHVLQAGYSLPF